MAVAKIGIRAPIALFVYNRLLNAEKTVSALQANAGFRESPLYIFCDGPKSEKERDKVQSVRNFVKNIEHDNIEIIERGENFGLKNSIYNGVSSVCAEHGSVIVVEDDLVFSPCCLDYFHIALKKYEDLPEIGSVVGYQFDVPAFQTIERMLVLPFTHPWGWATWDRAWSQFNIATPVDTTDLESAAFRYAFDAFGIRDFSKLLLMEKAGLVDSWFVLWHYHLFRSKKLSLFPPVTYVTNTGIHNGTHASSFSLSRLAPKRMSSRGVVCDLPESLSVDYWALDVIRRSTDARLQRMTGRFGRAKRKIKKWARA